jgi:hypothetical protein
MSKMPTINNEQLFIIHHLSYFILEDLYCHFSPQNKIIRNAIKSVKNMNKE